MQGNDVWVSEVLEDLDFAVQILLQLLVQSGELDGFDGDCSTRYLQIDVSQVPSLPTMTQVLGEMNAIRHDGQNRAIPLLSNEQAVGNRRR